MRNAQVIGEKNQIIQKKISKIYLLHVLFEKVIRWKCYFFWYFQHFSTETMKNRITFWNFFINLRNLLFTNFRRWLELSFFFVENCSKIIQRSKALWKPREGIPKIWALLISWWINTSRHHKGKGCKGYFLQNGDIYETRKFWLLCIFLNFCWKFQSYSSTSNRLT